MEPPSLLTRGSGYCCEPGPQPLIFALQEVFPMQNTPMYHYGIASAMGCAQHG